MRVAGESERQSMSSGDTYILTCRFLRYTHPKWRLFLVGKLKKRTVTDTRRNSTRERRGKKLPKTSWRKIVNGCKATSTTKKNSGGNICDAFRLLLINVAGVADGLIKINPRAVSFVVEFCMKPRYLLTRPLDEHQSKRNNNTQTHARQ